MKQVKELLIRLTELGVDLFVEDGKLKSRGAQGSIPAELAAQIRDNKAAIITLLSERQSRDTGPADLLVAVPGLEHYRLSHSQQRLWFVDRLGGGSSQYNIAAALRMEGPLERAALQRSLEMLVERHEVLRTTYAEVDGEGVQRIHAGRRLVLAEADLSQCDAAEQARQIKAMAAAEAAKPFDLAHDLMLRVSLLHLDAQAHVVLFTMHHIAFDGWSMGVLVKEFVALYQACQAGQGNPLAPLEIQYADYAHWQRGAAQQQRMAAQLEMCRARLAGIPPVHSLPLDKRRPAEQQFSGGRHYRRIEPAVASALHALAQQHEVTMFMLLQSAFALLLARWSGEDDIVMGSPIAGRNRREVEPLIGFFVNTLVLRTHLAPSLGFDALLRQNRQAILAAYEQQDVSFGALVEALQPERSLSHSPITQIDFSFRNNDKVSLDVPGLKIEQMLIDHTATKFDLELAIAEDDLGLHCQWTYADSLFEPSTIDRMAGAFAALLDAVLAQPDANIHALNLITSAQQQQLQQWNQSAREFDTQACIQQLVERQALQQGDAVALVYEDESLSYAQWNAEANRLAHYLRGRGVRAGALVGLCTERSLDSFIGILGILKAGAAYVPLDPAYPAERLEAMVADAGIGVVLTHKALLEEMPFDGLTTVLLDPVWRGVLFKGCADTNPVLEQDELTASSLAYVVYTSGSSGQPKGVLLEHRGAMNLALAQARTFAVQAHSRVLQFASFSFDAATSEWLMSAACGAALHICPQALRTDVDALARYLKQQRISHATLPPALLAHLPLDADYALESLIVAGEACDEQLAWAWAQRYRLFNAYGPSECTVCASIGQVTPGQRLTIGRAMDNTVLYVLNPAQTSVPAGVVGELYIGGAGVGRGYLNRPELTADKFVELNLTDAGPERLYRSGDLVRWTDGGELEFVGRIDAQVKLRGFRIELGEIEAALAAQQGVRAALVLAQGEGAAKRLVAYVVGDGADEAAEQRIARLRQSLQRSLPDYMVPAAFAMLDAFPLTPNGKVDVRALPQAVETAQQAFRAPETTTEVRLAALWSDLLKHETIGRDANFFEVGGNSLLGMRAISAIMEDFGVKLEVRVLFEYPVLAALAQYLDGQLQEVYQLIPKAPRDQPLPLSFAQQRLWFVDRLGGGSSQYNMPGALHMEGPLERAALQQSLEMLVERHEVLRTTYAEVDGEGVQRIHAGRRLVLAEADLSQCDAAEQARQIKAMAAAEAAKPFDLGHDLMLRVSLLHLDAQTHVVLFTMHHIAFDGWSMGVLVKEFVALYQACQAGQANPLAPLEIQYADYACWQRGAEQQQQIAAQLDACRLRLAGIPQVHSLPLDKRRPSEQQFSGGRHYRRIEPAVASGLHALAQQHDVTMFMLLQSAFALLLARWSGEDDIVMGSPIAGRNRREVEPLIGFFVNTLVLRTQLAPSLGFDALLRQNRQAILAAYEQQDVSFGALVEALQPERSLSHSPIAQIDFSFQNNDSVSLDLPGLKIEQMSIDHTATKFDLELSLAEDGHGLHCQWTYADSLFEPTTIERMAGAFAALLDAVLAQPDANIHALNLITPAQQQQLQQWNQSAREFDTQACIQQLVERQALQQGDAVALVYEDESLSYAQWNAEANRLAHYLRGRGVRAGALVGLCTERSLDSFIGILGILKAGAAYVPLDPAYPAERLEAMVADAGIGVVLTHKALLEEMPFDGLTTVLLDPVWRGVLFKGCADTNPVLEQDELTASSLAYVVYTSGSSGQPKGVLLEHRGAMNLALAQARTFAVQAHSRVLQFASFSFDAATSEWLMSAACGAALHICPQALRTDVDALARYLKQQRISHATLPPALLAHLPLDADYALESLIVAGEACDEQLAWAWAQRYRLFNAYGPSECTVCASIGQVTPGQRLTIGRAMDNTVLYVLNPAQTSVPAGVVGELYIGGAGVGRGYLNRPELTADKFVELNLTDAGPERLYRSGDLVRWTDGGELEFVGRIDAQVKLRGFRIELGEIEAALAAQQGVRAALVLAQGEGAAKRLVAYVVGDGADEAAEQRIAHLRQALQRSLPDYMVPAAFAMLDAFPLTPNGKIDVRALPVVDTSTQLVRSYSAPRTETERTLCRIWQELLKVEQVGIDDNFFTLGGDSILSIQAVSRANQAGIAISTKQLFEHQTVAALAAADLGVLHDTPQEAVQGAQLLLPIHHAFLEDGAGGKEHYNQAVLLQAPAGLDLAQVRAIAAALCARHDALRLRWRHAATGWEAHYQPFDQAELDQIVVQETLPDDLRARCGAHQASLALETGPLWKLVHFAAAPGQQGSRLFMVIHHLMVDGVSWRILLADLEQAHAQLSQGGPIALGRKSSSYQQWGAALSEHAASAALEQERAYWLAQGGAEAASLGPVHEAPATHASTAGVELALSEQETEALLKQCGQAYRTQINELLLAGVYLGLHQWSGQSAMRITLEGHGREDLFDQIDLTQTVGWFTTTYPLMLSSPAATPEAAIKSIKERCRAVPRRGIGYGILRHLAGDAALAQAEQDRPSWMVFNYLGQFDQSLSAQNAFAVAGEDSGSTVGPQTLRTHRLGLNGMVAQGRLRFRLDYSTEQYDAATMAALGQAIETGLRSVIEHCLDIEFGDFTPSDFPLARVSQQRLAEWQSRYAIEKLYPATSMQQGLLFHSLLDRRAYVIQTYPVFVGKLSTQHLRHAWQAIVERYDIFRTVFLGEDEVLHQLVVPAAVLPWHEEDWRGLSEHEQAARFEQYRQADLDQGFDFHQAPLQRVALFRLDDERYRMLWTHHHMVLDGWCSPLVYRDVMQAYRAYVTGTALVQAPAPAYEDYIAWLQRQDKGAAQAFWKSYLAPLEGPTPLAVDKLPTDGKTGYQDQGLVLDAERTARLQAYARGQQSTVNTLVQLAWGYLLHRYSGEAHVLFGATISGRPAEVAQVEAMVGLFINTIAVRVSFDGEQNTAALLAQLRSQFQQANEYGYLPLAEIQQQSAVPAGTGLFDSLLIFENYPLDAALEADTQRGADDLLIESVGVDEHTNYALTLSASLQEQLKLRLNYRGEQFADATVERMLGHLVRILEQLPSCQRISQIDLLSPQEHAQLQVWNLTERDYPRERCVHALFEDRARRHPERIALAIDADQLTYGELDQLANRMAGMLRQNGVKPGDFVGLCMDRSLAMVVGLLGILKAGGAYLPLDPRYPKSRIDHMVDDSGVSVIVTQPHMLAQLSYGGTRCLSVDLAQWRGDQHQPVQSMDVLPLVSSDSAAYMIYTSGSTGKPKGVMVSHRNVVAFIDAMRDTLDYAQGVWLAVTSLSFDISVLEIFGSLSAGFKVVLVPEAGPEKQEVESDQASESSDAQRQLDFSLCYFASSTQTDSKKIYQLLLDGARYADRNGYRAVWTPERHFAEFGGIYPNPSITSAAIATITNNIALRAGSCVLPLNDPIRVVEDWSIIDHLSDGRIGLAFASGWNVNDFALMPDNYADRHEKLYGAIDEFKRLWQGEAVQRRNGAGAEVGIRTFPRPLQALPPIWITAAGNPETFRRAGELGTHVLTHLLGQTFGELQEKIAAYRAAWDAAGHAGRGTVTLMVHTYVCEHDDEIQSKVKEPFKKYLGTALNLINTVRGELQEQGKAQEAIPPAEILEMAFQRYYKSSALFGTVDTCLDTVATLRKLGIDEFACLIDFGIDAGDVIPALDRLTRLKDLANRPQAKPRAAAPRSGLVPASVGELITRHEVTHLQCTPSLMTALLEHRDDARQFARLQRVLIGGESFPESLAAALRQVTQARIFNVYGPTEATVWATLHEVDPLQASMRIGRPLSNYQVSVVDSDLNALPVGVPGELLIGGEGVAIGYFKRPELTAERFVQLRGADGVQRRCYRTGDLGCYMPDGTLKHMGRMDDQVKLRGYRIELNEIAAQLLTLALFDEAVVLVVGSGPAARLVAFGTRNDGMAAGPASADFALAAAAQLREHLPDYMTPTQFIVCEQLPLTPNKKINKLALHELAIGQAVEKPYLAPQSATEQSVAEIWRVLLKVEQVGRDDNFFLLGGHSLSLMHLIAEIRNHFAVELSVRTAFNHAVLADLAAEIERALASKKNIARLEQLSHNENLSVQEILI